MVTTVTRLEDYMEKTVKRMKRTSTFKGFLIGTIFGAALIIGALYGSGHVKNNFKQTSYTFEATTLDNISFQ